MALRNEACHICATRVISSRKNASMQHAQIIYFQRMNTFVVFLTTDLKNVT